MLKAVESPLCGHAHKICDQIAEGIVDEYLRRDPESRLDIKVFGSHGMVVVAGEVFSKADFDCADLAKEIYHKIGYKDDIEVFVSLEEPSSEMKKNIGSADTIVIHGYATKETREYLPRPVVFVHEIARRLDNLRLTDPDFQWLGPDGKIQLVMEKQHIHSVSVFIQHPDTTLPHAVQSQILDQVLTPLIGEKGTKILINPIGSFTKGGFLAETGVSGMFSHADFYGGLLPHGNSSPIGKNPGRAERAGAFMARVAAKELVQHQLAQAAVVSLLYPLGEMEPSFLEVQAIGAEKTPDELKRFLVENFSFHLEAIVAFLDLKNTRYQPLAVHGMFGRNDRF